MSYVNPNYKSTLSALNDAANRELIVADPHRRTEAVPLFASVTAALEAGCVELERLQNTIRELDLEFYGPKPLNYEPDRAETVRAMKKELSNP